MINSSALLTDLKAQLRVLQADLKERADDSTTTWGAALHRDYAEALRRERTGLSWTAWRDNEVDQAAVAWVVATTFVRFCEDNDLLLGATLDGLPVPAGWIAGPGDRSFRARENQTAYFRVNTSHHDRDWLQQSFRVLAAQPAGTALVDPEHNPVWTAEISAETAKGLIDFWRRIDTDGALVHDFTDDDLGTRFLGDLYQDLSEHAKKTYALLQTPVFVEEFILDRTLTPAIQEFGVDGLRIIDPTCGSGHFLLGAFERLNRQWADEAPGLDPKQRVRRAMDSIYGVDLNPFAVAIARFRLTVAGILAAGENSLVGVPGLGFHLAIGDSLLGEQGTQGEIDVLAASEQKLFFYRGEDLSEHRGILAPGSFHVVVGNPPYITVKDSVLSKKYRKAYTTAAGKYALSVPFMELFFRLAIKGERGQGAGHVGQITSNSFMKREFGKKLIEELFAGFHSSNPVDLTHVVDTSGAYIPGHGTPTVILIGRRRRHVATEVRAVLGVRGEPGTPEDPAKGLVWTELVEHVDQPGFSGKHITVTDLTRTALSKHPWSLSGGGASSVKEAVDRAAARTLDQLSASLGITSFTLEDDVFVRDERALRTLGITDSRPMVLGDQLRDWRYDGSDRALFPYDSDLKPIDVAPDSVLFRAFWPYRTNLSNNRMFGDQTKVDAGLKWTEFGRLTASKLRTPLSITFAEVATHNHFVLDRGGKVFKQTAPVIKLPASATEAQHFELLGILNSSVACFWLKQVTHNKGSTVDSSGARQTTLPWEDFYQFNSTKVGQFPVPAVLPEWRGAVLDDYARALERVAPRAVVADWRRGHVEGGLADALVRAHERWSRLRERLVFEQEELDWEAYSIYGLVHESMTYDGSVVTLPLGQRAFEIALARRIEEGEEGPAWFERHGSTPTPDVPAEWPEDYRALVDKRLALMESDQSIRLLERPEYKRRWAINPWAKQLREALEAAILDRLEGAELWRDLQGPSTRSVAQLADLLRNDDVLLELARELTGNPEPNLATVIGSLASTEAVPYLAAYRYKPSGLEKFREWQTVWALQRCEDQGKDVSIPVPPKYSTPDFQRVEYWKARGKLDVPKERFVLYPGVGREGDVSLVLGWAGWSHRDQAVALVREIMNQQALGASNDAVVPMVAGLVELEPWLHQWHTKLEPEFGSSAAQAVTSQIDQFLVQLQMTRDDVTAWRPAAANRGRRPRA
jgi:hypothetical protein